MEVIWVLENVINKKKFYNKLQILLLVSSISLWRKYHSLHKTVLYCDKLTYEILDSLNILSLWSEVRPLTYPDKINKKIFWSGCKTKIISETKIPLIIIDHDFLIKRNIDEYLQNDIIYSYDEKDDGYYPLKNNKFVNKLTTPISRNTNKAANVSLFYLPNPEFSQRYGKQVLQNHMEFSNMEIDDLSPNYMILSEQLMLKEWLVNDKIPHKTLSKNLWDCHKIKNINKINDIGIWNLQESSLYYKHYGLEETQLKHPDNILKLNNEIDYLYRCINAGGLIDINVLKEKINYENRFWC